MARGYGVETWCFGELQPGRYATGTLLIAQALYRRLNTPRGTLRGPRESSASRYGLDLPGYVGAVGVDDAVAVFPGLIEAECAKDDRVASVSVTTSVSVALNGLRTVSVEIYIVPKGDLESFTLTLDVSEVSTTVVGVA